MISIPKRGRGRQSKEMQAQYNQDLEAFCDQILQIEARLDFKVSARGWCYILSEHGLHKGDFNTAQDLIAECRKTGLLPLDIVMEDGNRAANNLEWVDGTSPEEEAEDILQNALAAHSKYHPVSFWENQDHYIEMLVEKIDLKTLFEPICAQFHVPITNARGVWDLNCRAAIMRRFKEWSSDGKQCVLLYCGDHDPAGIHISDIVRSNMADLASAVGWFPDDVAIDRFGLNYDFIEENNLTWIDNLETGSGKRLDDPRHCDHYKPYVQNYLAEYGARKVEANALVVRPEAGRELCRAAILKYVDVHKAEDYRSLIDEEQTAVRDHVMQIMAMGGNSE